MKRKIFCAILLLIIVSQVPFVYRRYRLARLQTTIQQLSTQRTPPDSETQYVDYKGVIHVHTFLGGHSGGTFSELINAAKSNQLDFVLMTEHQQAEFSSAAMTLDGTFGQVLFVRGNEVVTTDGDRLLLLGGADTADRPANQTTNAVVTNAHPAAFAIAAYPTESETWKRSQVDGVEVYNLYTNAREINRVVTFMDGLWSYRSYPALMFANFFRRPDANLARWDEAMVKTNRRLVATAGNDAHSNVGLSLNDASGNQWIGLKLDPYERSFRTVRMHVLIRKGIAVTRESLLEALSNGHCYVSFDLFADGRGFEFAATKSEAIMGDEIAADLRSSLVVKTPLPARIVLLKNGNISDQRSGITAEFSPDGPGVYRVEAYLDSLPPPAKGQPWILSNPIYVR